MAIEVGANGGGTNVGACIYRLVPGQGGLSLTNVRVRWSYALNGVARSNRIDVAVHAIEMVRIPEGRFYVGDGAAAPIQGQFESGMGGTPFLITNETSTVTLGGGGAGSLGNHNGSGMFLAGDDFSNLTSRTLPAAFPKGHRAFYCMKYEITQGQYKDFLNALTRTQQAVRVADVSPAHFAMSGTGTITNRNGIRCPAVIPAGPVQFGCDFNSNGVFDEPGDGQDLACNFLAWADGAAYADWAGLRPMTSLEYEKVCRGPRMPVANEYAWGSTNITQQTGHAGTDGSGTETAIPATANCTYGNAAAIQGPVRVGIFAADSSSRVQVGAGYYGVMDLSGNVRQPMVSVGNAAGRGFTGAQGDGCLSARGDADVASWPGLDAVGCATVLADWSQSGCPSVSARYYGAYCPSNRDSRAGWRGVRTVP